LHDSLFRVQLEIQQYDERYDSEMLQKQAEEAFYTNASESQQRDDFNKMRLVELQENAIEKASHVLLSTLNRPIQQKECIFVYRNTPCFCLQKHPRNFIKYTFCISFKS